MTSGAQGKPQPQGWLGALYGAHGEKVRYLVVGVCNTAFGYALFLVQLAVLGPPLKTLASSPVAAIAQLGHGWYVVVQWVTWVLMVPVSTTTMKYFAFRKEGSLPRQVGRGYLVYLPAQGLSSLVLWLTVQVVGRTPQAGQLAAIAIVTALTYLGHKYFTFRTPGRPAE